MYVIVPKTTQNIYHLYSHQTKHKVQEIRNLLIYTKRKYIIGITQHRLILSGLK